MKYGISIEQQWSREKISIENKNYVMAEFYSNPLVQPKEQ